MKLKGSKKVAAILRILRLVGLKDLAKAKISTKSNTNSSDIISQSIQSIQSAKRKK